MNAVDNKMFKISPIIILYSIAICMLLGLGFLSPIAQDISYHNFADSRTLLGIENFWNVVSNLPFLFVGVYALYQFSIQKNLVCEESMLSAYFLLFGGILLVAFGSGYYHLLPNNETLIWDRLPMTIAFMALFAIVITEFISNKEGRRVLYPLLALGVGSVVYWAYTESIGRGDLRLYIFVQFFPILVIPMILLFMKSMFTLRRAYVYLLICYLIAKVCEHYDDEIYEILGFISGHSLKHMVAALGTYLLVRGFSKRTKCYEKNSFK